MEVIEKDKTWIEYSKEELITVIDCADKICEELIMETVIFLQNKLERKPNLVR